MENKITHTLSEGEVQNKVKEWFWPFIKLIREGKKINISDYREVEPDIDLFLNDIIIEIANFSGYQTREDIIREDFILDEQAKRALELQSNIDENLGQVNEVLDGGKTKSIEGINISYEELAERIGDLYYDSLAVFIADLKDNIDNKEIKSLLNEAFSNISTAWGYCEKPVEDYLESIKEKPEKVKTFKHTNQIKGIGIDNKELAKRIGNLVNSELSKFLEAFSEKMYKDGIADEGRIPSRIKLATELYSCASRLKEASQIL
ncbi:hypothetical protein CSA08_04515 [Candidatus Gracilibacteria bacterium]|nr:MAG: hypothetical protein CSA08_04515 [Candidatus Gracilibacteria bacterium]